MPLTKYDEQAHIANEKRWSYEDGFIDGFIDGYIDGYIQGVKIALYIKKQLQNHIPHETIILELQESFSLSREQAERYLLEITEG